MVKVLKYIFSPINKWTLLFTVAFAFHQYIALFNFLRISRNEGCNISVKKHSVWIWILYRFRLQGVYISINDLLMSSWWWQELHLKHSSCNVFLRIGISFVHTVPFVSLCTQCYSQKHVWDDYLLCWWMVYFFHNVFSHILSTVFSYLYSIQRLWEGLLILSLKRFLIPFCNHGNAQIESFAFMIRFQPWYWHILFGCKIICDSVW